MSVDQERYTETSGAVTIMTTGQVMDTEKAPNEGSLDSVPFPTLERLGQLRF